jgi:alpha-tubulin suppressor-like RCC1 family protein
MAETITLAKEVKQKKFKVTIHPTSADSSSELALSINGTVMQIQVGKEVELDEMWLEVLKNTAVPTQAQDKETGQMKAVPGTPRFAFSAMPA